MLKITERNNEITVDITDTKPEIIQIEMETNETIAEAFLGLMNPRKDGSVLYSIPKIISTGKSSHNSTRVSESVYLYPDRSIVADDKDDVLCEKVEVHPKPVYEI